MIRLDKHNQKMDEKPYRLLHGQFIQFFILTILYGLTSAAPIYSQEQGEWLLLRWPLRNIENESEIMTDEFESAWHENRIYRHLQKELRIIDSSQDSLSEFLNQLQSQNPQCVEADWDFAKKNLTNDRFAYIPILQFHKPFSTEAELIWDSSVSGPFDFIGVVSPDLSIGGGIQISRMKEKHGGEIQWHAFSSPREVLRQLLVGSIHAAATPAGYFDDMLRDIGRTDIVDRFQRERFPAETLRVYWLREDIYQDVFIRTVIVETWLRDRFADRLERFISKPVSVFDM